METYHHKQPNWLDLKMDQSQSKFKRLNSVVFNPGKHCGVLAISDPAMENEALISACLKNVTYVAMIYWLCFWDNKSQAIL